MKTKTSTWLFGFLNAVIIFVMVFGLLGSTPLLSVQASTSADTPPVGFDPAGMPSDDAQRHPYTLPDSAARFERPDPVADRSAISSAYRPDRMPAVSENAEQPVLPAFIPPVTPDGISTNTDNTFAVDLVQDLVWSWGWPAYSDLTLKVGTDTYYLTSDATGFGGWWYLGHDFVTGEVVTMSDGTLIKSHKIQKLVLTSLDQDLDILKGLAKPSVDVWVEAHDYNSDVMIKVTSNIDGIFKAKLGSVGIDLAPNTRGWLQRFDSDGDRTVAFWEIPDPCFGVNLNWNYVAGWEWTAGNTAILKVDGTEINTTTVEPNGNVHFDTPDILPGQVVTVSDGVSTKSTTVTLISVTNVDIATDTISGTAGPNSAVYVDTLGTTIFADSLGHWVADLSDYYDVVPGSEGWVRRIDNDGDSSEWRWYAPNPVFDVRPGDDIVQGWQFLPETEVTIQVEGHTYYQTTGADGYFETGSLDYDIQTDDLVVVSDGTYTKDHTVYPSTLTGYDVDADTLTGIAAPNREVGAWACTDVNCDSLTTTTDSSGDWTLDFTGVVDLKRGFGGGMWQSDDEDDDTVTYWWIPDPYFSVNLNEDYIYCGSWASYSTLTLNVDGEELATIETDSNGYAQIYNVDIQPGSTVIVSGGGLTKQTVVENLTLIGVDRDADTVSGTADSNTEVIVETYDQNWQQNGEVHTTADSAGNWIADFSGILDITVGTRGFPMIYDADGDSTEVKWEIPVPWFVVKPMTDSVFGGDWTPGSSITLKYDSYTDTRIANENGEIDFGSVGFDIVNGVNIEVTDGITTKYLIVHNLAFTGYDVDLDTLAGKTDPGTWAQAVVCNGNDCSFELYTDSVDAFGNWSLDFSEIVDLKPGSWGWISKWDDDGDNTSIDWYIPNPSFTVNPFDDTVWGWKWPAFTDVTLSVHGETYTLTTNYWGDVDFGKMDFDIIPGDTLEMSDGDTTKTHTVYPLTYPDIDWELDTVSGSTNPGGEVYIWACTNGDCYGLDDTADAGGTWSVDFTGFIDIVPGSDGGVQQWDPDVDDTRIYWNVPRPYFTVNLNYDYIWGYEWEPFSTVTVNVRGIDVTTDTVLEDSSIGIGIADFNIQPGDTVTVRDDQITKTLIVRDITLTKVDEISNTISGTADAGIEIDVGYSGDDNYYNVYVITDSSGKWSADFDTIGIDIGLGDLGYAQIRDEIGEEDGDYTEVRWDVYTPVYPAYLEKLTTSKVTFDWEDTLGATAYKIQLSTKSNFSTLLLSASSVDSVYPYATKLANNTTYYWRVKAKVGGVWSGWKPVWQFTSMDPLAKPVLISPPPGLTLPFKTAGLDWEPVTNGFTYLVQISKLADFSTTYFKTTTDKTEFLTNPLPKGKYFWRVRAIDASGGKGPWSEVRWFKIVVP